MRYIIPEDHPELAQSVLLLEALLKCAASNVVELRERANLVNADGTVRWRDVPERQRVALWTSLNAAHDCLGMHIEAGNMARNGDEREASR